MWLKKMGLCTLLFCSFMAKAEIDTAPAINRLVIFGDSLSDNGNTGHLLKSINQQENPTYLIAPFQEFIIDKMKNFGQSYHIPMSIVTEGIKQVNTFFDSQFAPLLATLIAHIREVPVLPDQPYWQWHFSNGPVWNEYLSSMLDIPISDPLRYTNQAFGGSWAASYDYKLTVWNLIYHPLLSLKNLVAGKLIPPSLGITVETYLLNNSELTGDSLFFLFSGGNDYLNLYTLMDEPNSNYINLYVNNVIDSIHAVYKKLVTAGARQLVVMSLPLVGDVPKFANTEEQVLINQATHLHNQRLAAAVQKWQVENPTVKLVFIDLEQFLRKAQQNPLEYGLTNIHDACIDIKLPMLIPPTHSIFKNNLVLENVVQLIKKNASYHSCTTPDHFLFWDEIHPTTHMHQHLAYTVCLALVSHGYLANCVL